MKRLKRYMSGITLKKQYIFKFILVMLLPLVTAEAVFYTLHVRSVEKDAVKLIEYRLAQSQQLVDARVGATKDDLVMLDWLQRSGIPYIVVATKADKLSKAALAKALDDIRASALPDADIPLLPFSSETRAGKQELWNEILARTGLL